MLTIGIDAHDLEGNRTGVGRYLMSILRSWEANGATANDRIVLFFKKSVPRDIPSGFEIRILQSFLGRPSNALFVHFFLPLAVRREKIDVLFCPGYVGPLFSRRPIVLTLHDIIYEARPKLFNWRGPQDRLLLKFVSKISARRAKRILVPSQFTANEVKRCYRIPDERIIVTPEAADASFRQPQDRAETQAVAQQYGVAKSFIFFVGSIFTRRHVPECMRAFVAIASEFPNHQLLIAGANLTRPRIPLEPFISDLNVKMRRRGIVWIPYVDPAHLPALYNAADLTVYLSDYEGFGLPPLESLACGTPVLTTNAASLPETVGSCAYLLDDPIDVAEIAQAMRQLLNDTMLRQKLIACGLQRAEQFSWERCAAQTFKAIREAATT